MEHKNSQIEQAGTRQGSATAMACMSARTLKQPMMTMMQKVNGRNHHFKISVQDSSCVVSRRDANREALTKKMADQSIGQEDSSFQSSKRTKSSTSSLKSTVKMDDPTLQTQEDNNPENYQNTTINQQSITKIKKMMSATISTSEQNTVIKSFHVSKFSIQRSDMPNRIELQTSRDNYQLKKKGEDISPLKMMIKTSNL